MKDMSSKRILIVDDSEFDSFILNENLEDQYELLNASDGNQAIQIASEHVPDLILMDVSMPGMDGYQICSLIKNDPLLDKVDVIFISANDSVEEKIRGYEAGGSDYLVKPVDIDELQRKVKFSLESSEQRLSLTEQKREALNFAEIVKAEYIEQVYITGFLRNCFSSTSIQNLAKLVADSVGRFGLTNNVQIRTPSGIVDVSTNEPVPPLEKELLYRLRDHGRMHELGNRFIMNYSVVSILIRNMPEDPNLCGRLRDHIALILHAAESHCKKLMLDEDLLRIIEESNKSLLEVQTVQAEQRQTNVNIIDRLMDEVEHAFLSFGLTDEQEDTFRQIITKAVDDSLDNYEAGLNNDEKLKILIERLTGILDVEEETVQDQNTFLF